MFRPVALSLLCLAALTGCDDNGVRISSRETDTEGRGVLRVIDSLQCPETLGSLTRKGSASSDGAVCSYSGPRGAEVSLHLVRLDGADTVDAVLARFEQGLAASMPEAAARIHADIAGADADKARSEADKAQAMADEARDAADAAQDQADRAASQTARVTAPGVRIVAEDEKASVRLPGIHIEANGDNANVRIGGMQIESHDGRGARTETASVSVNARDQATQVRTQAPGEAVRANYILTDDQSAPGAWSVVGYEARGPRGGPIVVATLRAKSGGRDNVFDDARELVALNVGQ